MLMTDSDQRITRLEESQSFAAREVEELSAQVRELHALVAKLTRRIETIEQWRAGEQADEPAAE